MPKDSKVSPPKDEIHMSYEAIRVQHLSRITIDDSDRDLTSPQTRSLPSVPVPTPALRDVPQRVPDAPKDRQLSPSSKESDQQDSRAIGIPDLLNPAICKGRLNARSGPGSLSLPRINMDLPISSRPDTRSLCLVRSSSPRKESGGSPPSNTEL